MSKRKNEMPGLGYFLPRAAVLALFSALIKSSEAVGLPLRDNPGSSNITLPDNITQTLNETQRAIEVATQQLEAADKRNKELGISSENNANSKGAAKKKSTSAPVTGVTTLDAGNCAYIDTKLIARLPTTKIDGITGHFAEIKLAGGRRLIICADPIKYNDVGEQKYRSILLDANERLTAKMMDWYNFINRAEGGRALSITPGSTVRLYTIKGNASPSLYSAPPNYAIVSVQEFHKENVKPGHPGGGYWSTSWTASTAVIAGNEHAVTVPNQFLSPKKVEECPEESGPAYHQHDVNKIQGRGLSQDSEMNLSVNSAVAYVNGERFELEGKASFFRKGSGKFGG